MGRIKFSRKRLLMLFYLPVVLTMCGLAAFAFYKAATDTTDLPSQQEIRAHQEYMDRVIRQDIREQLMRDNPGEMGRVIADGISGIRGPR